MKPGEKLAKPFSQAPAIVAAVRPWRGRFGGRWEPRCWTCLQWSTSWRLSLQHNTSSSVNKTASLSAGLRVSFVNFNWRRERLKFLLHVGSKLYHEQDFFYFFHFFSSKKLIFCFKKVFRRFSNYFSPWLSTFPLTDELKSANTQSAASPIFKKYFFSHFSIPPFHVFLFSEILPTLRQLCNHFFPLSMDHFNCKEKFEKNFRQQLVHKRGVGSNNF